MAAQVLSGSGNVTYTNSTGQNVRLVINYLRLGVGTATISFQGASFTMASFAQIGKSIPLDRTLPNAAAYPTEFAISNGETFSIIHTQSSANIEAYNFIIIPEAG